MAKGTEAALANAPATDITAPYEPTLQERTAAGRHLDRRRQRPPAPRIKLSGDGKNVGLGTNHPLKSLGLSLLMEAFGTPDHDFFDGLMGQLVNVSATNGEPDESALNFMAAMIRGIGPQDDAECMLAAQMAAVHMAIMTFARRLNHVDNIPQQDSASNAFNKLARTFAVQLEALKRYRTGGEQRVTVQHVTVNEGGQAIVGAVTPPTGGAGHAEKS